MAKTFLGFEMQKFRRQIGDWYGCLSILELSVNSTLVRKIHDIDTLLETMISDKLTHENQQSKLRKLNDELRELWESINPSEKERRFVFNRFLELQKQIQAVQLKNIKLNEKD